MTKTTLKKIYRMFRPAKSNKSHPEFGGSGITEDCYRWIVDNIRPGAKILEFGAGLVSTPKLGEIFTLTSIEHNEQYIGQFNSNYIHAPLSKRDGWYRRDKVEKIKDLKFELAIIDGPPGSGNRFGILLNLDLISKIPFILIDDADRPSEKILLQLLAQNLNSEFTDFGHFAVITNRS
jgi:hypothetical protein